MCGIAGVLALDGGPVNVSRVKPMVDAIAHRGPDDSGYLMWQTGRASAGGQSFGQAFTDGVFGQISPDLPVIDSGSGEQLLREQPWDLFLGHRRLSVIDLSHWGHQPMTDTSGRVWLAYNGVIYNFRELRDELAAAGHEFRGHSDTEVLLHAYLEWGIDCVDRLNGMFAFAVWDSGLGKLYLARDRYGIKPLYYAEIGGSLVFASEIKSILRYVPSAPKVDLVALNEYFSFQNIFSDRTLFDGVKLIPAASVMEVDTNKSSRTVRQFWDFEFTDEINDSPVEIQQRLQHLIRSAVRRQSVAEVDLGSYLSGGIDSATIATATTEVLGKICTFTAGFDLSEATAHELHFDERQAAERMSNSLGSKHYECVLHSGDMEAVMDDLIWHLEDLRLGQSYPNFHVAGLAGKFVKVVMSGAGGDELFGGYPWRYKAAIADNHANYIEYYYRYWQRLVDDEQKPQLFRKDIGDELKDILGGNGRAMSDATRSVFRDVFPEKFSSSTIQEQVNHSLYFECKTFLHGFLLVEDRLSMAHGLETRMPFLDNELVDYACRIPVDLKINDLDQLETIDENLPRKKVLYRQRSVAGKTILRSAMEDILPPEVTTAEKQGFSAPDESWFKGSGEAYVRDTLLSPSARLNTYLDPKFVDGVVAAHSSGRENKRLLIWSLLSFETWLRRFH